MEPSTSHEAVICGLFLPEDRLSPDQKLYELEGLVKAAGGRVVARTWQKAERHGRAKSASTFVGKGKAEELRDLVAEHGAGLLVFDNELSPAQGRELAEVVGCRVIDRSELILDIFAGRARSREAVLQVELAQLQYTAPRLRGMWTHLERAGAGIGSRGPGETQIEVDRRLVKGRINRLRDELAELHARKVRSIESRGQNAYSVGLVGYTNAGKSTLLNTLTGAGTFAQDALFATLDTLTRRWRLEGNTEVVLSDTVGFVRDLPHHLVASFRATLEEALHADLLLHVVDAAHPLALEQVEAVEEVLDELGCDRSRVLAVLNKVDAIQDEAVLERLKARLADHVVVSAKKDLGLDVLAATVLARRVASWVRVRLVGEVGAGRLRALAHAQGRVDSESFDAQHWTAEATVPRALLGSLAQLGASIEELDAVR